MTFRVVRTNQYNQDLGLIHSTNGNHLESPNEGSSIDHQAPGSDYFSNGNSTSLVAPNQVHDRFPIPLLESTRIPTNISRAEPPRQEDRSEVRRRRREKERRRGG
ncbi:UDP-glucuronic acid decarboxylase 2-like [Dorcoceras hygrometricum]|uniref:UDP-glucuronic acid decarboxylase 2-like n=1 Tax=Dorcoceras hygrometricum TaxID=472368 RepID=A0A2Z7BMD1_9LAMI|nr:UDP-glucuronic acid decarboxylase 2-like [Dorcoceras hygrometricum]